MVTFIYISRKELIMRNPDGRDYNKEDLRAAIIFAVISAVVMSLVQVVYLLCPSLGLSTVCGTYVCFGVSFALSVNVILLYYDERR